MKKFIAILLLSLTSSLYALPSCPSDKNQIYDNCFGTETFDNGNYVGEWKDNKMHGLGTYTYASGKRDEGYYMKDKYVPDICEGMGLSKGSSGFEQCVLKLIDKL